MLVAFMTLGWVVSLVRKDASVVDPLWGLGFIVAAVSYLVLLDDHRVGEAREVLVLAMVSAWGLRLSGYLLWRNRGRGEDPRYRAMRAKRPASFWWYSPPAAGIRRHSTREEPQHIQTRLPGIRGTDQPLHPVAPTPRGRQGASPVIEVVVNDMMQRGYSVHPSPRPPAAASHPDFRPS